MRGSIMNDLFVASELHYRVNRIHQDWRPIRARRLRKRAQREADANPSTWIG